MRPILRFVGLFALAVLLALFASNNPGSISVFWPPYRIDVSLNLALLVLMAVFVVLHLALKLLAALLALPSQARSWRLRHQERTMHLALLDALSHLIDGRFSRARKAAELVLARLDAAAHNDELWPDAPRLRVLAHLLAAEGAQALQDRLARDAHLQQALAQSSQSNGTRDGVQLRALRWALEDRDTKAALDWLEQLPPGVARRTLALRLRLKVARLAGNNELALETARLLAKHKAFSEPAALGLQRALALECVHGKHDSQQLVAAWARFESAEQNMPEVALQAAARLIWLGGPVEQAFAWLLPVWQLMLQTPSKLEPEQKTALIRVIEDGFCVAGSNIDAAWLARIEQAQSAAPGDAALQYLAAVVCLQLQLWGKAQQLISQALARLDDAGLRQRAWQVQAELAQRQGNQELALTAWKNASQDSLRRLS